MEVLAPGFETLVIDEEVGASLPVLEVVHFGKERHLRSSRDCK